MAENRAHLLAELAHVPDQQRTARFVCHLAVANPAGEIVVEASGACAGCVRREPTAGSFGFGYDALFEVADVHRTLAELPPEITAAVGHRGRAVRALAAGWRRQAEGWRPAAFSLRPPPAAR
jgi:XTP/dITP diphosphohydrolase